jgi:CxxC motif-containing protein (DUF1111 family)
MKLLKVFAVLLFATAIALPMWLAQTVEGQGGGLQEAPTVDLGHTITGENIEELFNGFGDLGTPVPDGEEPVPERSFIDNVAIFAAQEEVDEGLGPVYNARSCGECHDNTAIGGRSQIAELRAGRTVNGVFSPQDDNTLINQRAINAQLIERVADSSNNRGLRMSNNVLGDGFVECIDSNAIIAVRNAQPAAQRGTVVSVPVLEGAPGAPPANRVGRFGWKNQHASLISFSADAYVNEMGITSVLLPTENTSNGRSVAAFDDVPDPEEAAEDGFPFGPDIHAFASFMRQTRAPGRGPGSAAVTRGSNNFNNIGCAVCHTRTFNTLPAGTVINRGTFTVPRELGDEIIHPFSDFLAHNIGTGDGIPGPAGTENSFRTSPLWGIRSHTSMFMHDGLSFTLNDAIQRHAGQANTAKNNFNALNAGQRADVIAFLNSL